MVREQLHPKASATPNEHSSHACTSVVHCQMHGRRREHVLTHALVFLELRVDGAARYSFGTASRTYLLNPIETRHSGKIRRAAHIRDMVQLNVLPAFPGRHRRARIYVSEAIDWSRRVLESTLFTSFVDCKDPCRCVIIGFGRVCYVFMPSPGYRISHSFVVERRSIQS